MLKIGNNWYEMPANTLFTYNGENYYVMRPMGGAGTLEFIGGKGTLSMFRSYRYAITILKGGLTPAGRALAKHPNVLGNWYGRNQINHKRR